MQAAGTLSGGQQQMLAISIGLTSNPKLIVLDEPSLGLAPIVIMEIGRTL
jgi:branched-chain amino acid transport system ATP-binding protein